MKWEEPKVPPPPELTREDLLACADEAHEWREQVKNGDFSYDESEAKKLWDEYRAHTVAPADLRERDSGARWGPWAMWQRCTLRGKATRFLYMMGIEDERKRAASLPDHAIGHFREEGARIEREAVVRWLREAVSSIDATRSEYDQVRADVCDSIADSIEKGAHLTPPEPTREQAEERLRREVPDIDTLPPRVFDAAVEAMLAEMQKRQQP
jgi:hypothetical protein